MEHSTIVRHEIQHGVEFNYSADQKVARLITAAGEPRRCTRFLDRTELRKLREWIEEAESKMLPDDAPEQAPDFISPRELTEAEKAYALTLAPRQYDRPLRTELLWVVQWAERVRAPEFSKQRMRDLQARIERAFLMDDAAVLEKEPN